MFDEIMLSIAFSKDVIETHFSRDTSPVNHD